MKARQLVFLLVGMLASVAAAESYTVKAGDTLYRVARNHQLEPEALMQLNHLSSTTIEVGQKLQVSAATAAHAAPGQASRASTSQAGRSQASTSQASKSHAGVVRTAAFRFLGIPYRLGGTGQGAIDCSGFTRAVMAQLGIHLPRTSREQFNLGAAVSISDLREGDLVFFNTLGRGISHVGIYLGGGQFAHANSYNGRTMIEDFGSPYYRQRFVGARRVLPRT